MADLVYMHKDKWTDHLDAIRAKAGTSDTMTVDEATTAVEGISGGTDTSDATLNSGGQMLGGVTAYSKGTKYTGTIPTQAAATITPTESAQTAVSAGKYTAGDVTVGAIPSDYIGTDIPRRSSISVSQDNNTIHVEDGYYEDDIDTSMGACTVTGASVSIDSQGDATGSIIVGRGGYITSGSHAFHVDDVVTPRSSSDLTASGATVSVPYGYYSADASKTVASGSAGTPTATKGSVSNHAVNVTPSVTNTTGYITGGTVTGTAVSVSASELVSGNKAITENGTGIDVANYSTVSVDVQGSSTVSVVDTTDSGGGTVRTITASGTTIPTPASDISKLILNGVTQMDVTDTTATVSDVASGKVFTQVDGTTGTGTASSGGDLVTFISNGQLGDYTFYDTVVDDWCFAYNKFNSLTLPNVVDLQKDHVFRSATIGVLNLPNLKKARNNVFYMLNTPRLSLPELLEIGTSGFENCTASELYLPKFIKANGQTIFKGMANLVSIDLPACTTPNNWTFERCTSLSYADFGVLSTMPQGMFNFCTALDTLVLRNTTMVSLSNVNAFNNMGGKAVNVYVPSNLISSYQSASNWSAVTGATLTFVALEGSIYE